jgi:hypothetical protein
MSLAFLRGALNCGYLHLRLSLPPFSLCLPASLPPCLLLPPCLPASLPLTASLPPCLLASLPPCLPASLPPCLPASLPPFSLCLPLYLSQPLSTSRSLSLPLVASLYLSLPLSASRHLPLPLSASLLLCIVLCECVTAAKVNIFMTLCTTLSFSYTIVGTTKVSQISRDGLSLHRLYAELSTGGPSRESNPNSPLPVNLFTLVRNVNADFIITKEAHSRFSWNTIDLLMRSCFEEARVPGRLCVDLS